MHPYGFIKIGNASKMFGLNRANCVGGGSDGASNGIYNFNI